MDKIFDNISEKLRVEFAPWVKINDAKSEW